ncbi:capsular polysaccharide biosynthesis protein [Catalinimonas alkaloidigena]|uniref:glycosyltransferase family 61 protein n=1 Tax=Catalinimonas alkaloidigena TaxID=1075417 RepID=UPI00240716E7|nr:glycosyltransferase family 61 protein [Catalinimonas alkaloidigena]MDF9799693.1 capsular polysaccharide biosynthesis protein [Catalinimonas alkaloidigena]
MSISINYEHIRLLKRSARSLVWNVLNQFRYSHPGPKKVGNVNIADAQHTTILWRGVQPQAQYFSDQFKERFSVPENISFTQPFVAKIGRGHVFGKRGDVITPDGMILTDVCPEIPRRKDHHFLISRGKMPKPGFIDGRVMVLSCGPHYNYFHFTFDVISRLSMFRQAGQTADYYYIVQEKPFQRDLAKIFDIPASKIIPLKKDTHLVAKELIVSSLPGNHHQNTLVNLKDIDTYQFIRKLVCDKINKDKLKHADLIYIQRKGRRTVENEEGLLEKLQEFGNWKVVQLEEYRVLEQAEIFYHAKVIIGLHGAGLTNIVYCKSNTTLIEIFNPAYVEPLYCHMANLLELKYFPLIAEREHSYLRKEKDVKGSVRIDLEKLRECLESVFESRMLF